MINIRKNLSEVENVICFFKENNINVKFNNFEYEEYFKNETISSVELKMKRLTNLRNDLSLYCESNIINRFLENFNIKGDIKFSLKVNNFSDFIPELFKFSFDAITVEYFNFENNIFKKDYVLDDNLFSSKYKIEFGSDYCDFNKANEIFQSIANEKNHSNEDLLELSYNLSVYHIVDFFLKKELKNLESIQNSFDDYEIIKSLFKIFPKNNIKSVKSVLDFLKKIVPEIKPNVYYSINVCTYVLEQNQIKFFQHNLSFKLDFEFFFDSLIANGKSITMNKFANILDNTFSYNNQLQLDLDSRNAIPDFILDNGRSERYCFLEDFVKKENLKLNITNF